MKFILITFFTSYDLVHTQSLDLRITGSLLFVQTGLPSVPFKMINWQKKRCEDVDFKFDNKEKILFVKWIDNSLVTVGTKHSTVEPYAKEPIRWPSGMERLLLDR